MGVPMTALVREHAELRAAVLGDHGQQGVVEEQVHGQRTQVERNDAQVPGNKVIEDAGRQQDTPGHRHAV